MYKRSVKKQIVISALLLTAFAFKAGAGAANALPTPPEIWKSYDPDKGDFKEEIIKEETKDGIYYKDAYISAYVNGQEVRVYCKYAVKAGAKNAPELHLTPAEGVGGISGFRPIDNRRGTSSNQFPIPNGKRRAVQI